MDEKHTAHSWSHKHRLLRLSTLTWWKPKALWDGEQRQDHVAELHSVQVGLHDVLASGSKSVCSGHTVGVQTRLHNIVYWSSSLNHQQMGHWYRDWWGTAIHHFIHAMGEISHKGWHYLQCCQLSNFSDYPSNFFFQKHLATNLAIFISTFDKWLRQ